MDGFKMIASNIKDVRKNIETACEKAGRDPKEVTLICVSKTKPESDIIEAYNVGERDFGENKVQEMCEKAEDLNDDIRWHMIGHLQRNKVKYLTDSAYLIHSVDSKRLLEQIEKEYEKAGKTARVLLEINVALEDSKFGYTCESVIEDLPFIETLNHVKVVGLMTVAPYTDNSEENRKYFKKLKELSVDIESKKYNNISMEELSMGLTGDYMIAIEEGATIVRVGTGIFGNRNYNV